MSLAQNQTLVGQVLEVLVEGPGKKAKAAHLPGMNAGRGDSCESQLMGRSTTNRVVTFDGKPADIGDIVSIRIHHATAYSLRGEKVQ